MLGEKLGEASGQITGARVLPEGKMEISFQGRGMVLGHEMTETGTYVQTILRPGVFHGEGRTIAMTADGSMYAWKGSGIGKPSGPAPAGKFGVAGSFLEATGDLERLMGVFAVIEYEVDAERNYHWIAYEWTG